MSALQKYKEEARLAKERNAELVAQLQEANTHLEISERKVEDLRRLLRASPSEYALLLPQFHANYPGFL